MNLLDEDRAIAFRYCPCPMLASRKNMRGKHITNKKVHSEFILKIVIHSDLKEVGFLVVEILSVFFG